jgi:hypothetical protein
MADPLGSALERALFYDPRIWASPDRLRAVLMDLCPGKQAHRRVLVAAAEAGITASLASLPAGRPPSASEIRRLASRLQAQTGTDPAFADWAVQLWSTALGLTSGLDLREPPVFESVPRSAPSPAPPAPVPVSASLHFPVVPVLKAPPPSHAAVAPRPLPPVRPPRTRHMSRLLLAIGLLAAMALGWSLYSSGWTLSATPKQATTVVQENFPLPPPSWWNDPGNQRKLETTFVGTWDLQGGQKQVIVLEIRSVHAKSGVGFFEYTVNTGGTRADNLGRLQRGRLSLPNLGTVEVRLDEGRVVLLGLGPSPANRWELRAIP